MSETIVKEIIAVLIALAANDMVDVAVDELKLSPVMSKMIHLTLVLVVAAALYSATKGKHVM